MCNHSLLSFYVGLTVLSLMFQSTYFFCMYPNITVWLNISSLFIYYILCILVSVDEYLAPICLLWAMLLWTLAFTYFRECLFSVILGIYQDVDFYIIIIMYLYVLGTLEMFSRVTSVFHIPTGNTQGVQFPHFLINTFCFSLLKSYKLF